MSACAEPKPACATSGKLEYAGVLEWLVLLAILFHGTQASCNILGGPKGSATMFVSIADVLLGFAFIAWIARRVARRDYHWPPVVLPLAAAGWMVLSMAALLLRTKTAGSPAGVAARSGAKEIVQFSGYFIVGMAVFMEAFRSERIRRWGVAALAVAAGASVLTAALKYFGKVPARDVAGWGFLDRHTFGMFIALAAPIIFGAALFGCNCMLRALAIFLLLASLCVVLAGGPFLALCAGLLLVAGLRGRGAFIVTAAGLLLVCGLLLPRLPRRNSDVLLDSVALYRTGDPYGTFNEVVPEAQERLMAKRSALVAKIRDSQPVDSPGEVPDESDYAWKWSQRYQEWQAAMNMMSERPLLGAGPGAYQTSIGPYFRDMPKYAKNLMEPDALSFYMVWGASVGVPFLLLLGWMLVGALRSAGEALFGERPAFDRGLAAGVLGSLLAFLIGGVFTDPLVRGVGITVALTLALALSLTSARAQTAAEKQTCG